MSTEPYVPTSEQVRDQFATRMAPHLDEARRRSFDRWLASHNAKIEADALREAAERLPSGEMWPIPDIDTNPRNFASRFLHKRADRIEEEA